jgi:hypothetical protein
MVINLDDIMVMSWDTLWQFVAASGKWMDDDYRAKMGILHSYKLE